MNPRPKHIAIIMDGNGRWAKERGHNRLWGHIRGAKAARQIIEASSRLKIRHLTLFTFSTENWNRPKKEVNFLMSLLSRQLDRELQTLMSNNVKFRTLGNLSQLPDNIREKIKDVKEHTKNNTGLTLTFAINYSGQQELTHCFKMLAEKVLSKKLHPNDISESLINQSLPSAYQDTPELIIRTSGEYRLSNFFLWQAAYSELFFVEKYWPDFNSEDLTEIIRQYTHKERRFGFITEQLKQQEVHTPNTVTLLN
ncbi:MAG: isoprenyl transferase [Bdellovibrionaceae bacterium]|jgi:undecaprenyl diphosphate synthase|nr:isoprenyl transferase [Pseudobdellovibrionaceae bacterium]